MAEAFRDMLPGRSRDSSPSPSTWDSWSTTNGSRREDNRLSRRLKAARLKTPATVEVDLHTPGS